MVDGGGLVVGVEEVEGGNLRVKGVYVAPSGARPQNLYRSPFNKLMQRGRPSLDAAGRGRIKPT